MSRSDLHSNAFVLSFSLLIVLSSLSTVNLPLETVSAEPTRGEENTWYVDDDAAAGGDGSEGDPYNKIQDAVNASEDGDAIRVFDGTYFENVVVNNSVNLIGNGSETTTIDGGETGNVIRIVRDDVNVSGFRVTGSGSSGYPYYDSGIRVESDSNYIFENNCSNNNYYGIYLLTSDDSILTNNTASDNTNIGIQFRESRRNTIIGNTVMNNSQGIWLINSYYNTLTNNIASNSNSNDGAGIRLFGSNHNTITNNTCSNNLVSLYGAIYLDDSEYNSITNNNASDNIGAGIKLFRSDSNTLTGNTIHNNSYGISLSVSSYNTFAKNYMVENGILIEAVNLEQINTHSIETTNTVNGKPVFYYKDSDWITVPSGAGQIIIANCDNMVVADQNLSNGSVSILVAYSSYITIQNNVCNYNGKHGIYLYESNQNTIVNNTCSNNKGSGIYFFSSSDSNTITNNTCSSNRDSGIRLYRSEDCTITNNTCSSNNDEGIFLWESSACTMKNNICSLNSDSGIILSFSVDCTIMNNTCSNNDNGIRLSRSNSNTLTNNTISENGVGISLQSSSQENKAHYNNIYNNTEYSIDASDNDDYTINAIDNWWGAPSGPYHPIKNSEGNGDNVTDFVDFYPWFSEKLFRTSYVSKYGDDTIGNGTKENPFLTVQKAVNICRHGDTIRVFEGVYEENIVVDKSVEIIGNGSGETVIQGEGGSEFEITERGGYASGVPEGIAVDGNYTYIATGAHGLIILDVTNASYPILLGQCDTRGTALDVVVDDDFAYVANGESGLVIIDIQDKSKPRYYGTLDTIGVAQAIVIEGDIAYLADGSNGLVIVDISDKSNPSVLGGIETLENVRDTAIQGEYAYLVDYYNGVVIVNVSDPNNLTIDGQYDSDNYPKGICVVDENAYVADGNNGLLILDIRDSSDPQLVSIYETDGPLYDVEVMNDRAYLATNWVGLEILNISDKENPRKIGEYVTYDDAFDVAVGNNLAFIAAGDWYGVLIIDISDEIEPTLSTKYNTFGKAKDVDIEDDYAYVADYYNGLLVLDVSDVDNPVKVGHVDTPGYARSVQVIDNYAYISGAGSGLIIIDVANKSSPIQVGHYDPTGNVYQVDVIGNLAYVAVASSGDDNGLIILDISNKSDPQLVGSYLYDGFARAVEVEGSFAYIPDRGLVIVNVTNPSDPQRESYWDGSPANIMTALTVKDDYVYLLSQAGGGVRIIDVSNKKYPIQRGSYFIGYPFGIDVKGDFAYVASMLDGMIILDVSDKRDVTYFAGYDTIGSVNNVRADGRYAYVADSTNGMIIVEMISPSEAALEISAPFTKLSGLTIRNGSRSGVLIDADNVEVEHCEITENYDGVKVINGSENSEIYNCDIFENNAYGINATDNNGKSINALNNWWGHPSGPYHPILNQDGLGNAVSDYVNFEPWLSRPIDFRIHHVSTKGNDTIGNGDKGNPYQTIQKAIDIAQEWDTIIVANGIYTETITANKRNVTIIADSPGTTTLDGRGAPAAGIIIANDVEINGFTIRNSTDNGILIANSSGARITNCVFTDNTLDLNLTNSKNNQLINITFEIIYFSDTKSSVSILWPLDLKVTDNRDGFIPNAHMKITDRFGTTIFDGYTDDRGRIPQINLLNYDEDISSHIDYNPYTISIWKDGYLNFAEEFTITSYTRHTSELETHILPVAMISGELVRYVDMDSQISFDGSESTGRNKSYFWDLWDHGNWSTSDSSSFSHLYKVPGFYQVNLIVTDDHKNSSTASVVVIVENVPPAAVVGADTYSAFEDEPFLFDASGSWDTASDSLSFFWGFGDGTQSAEVSPIHVFQEQGEYEVSLTVMDLYGGESTTIISVTVTNIEPWIIETNITGMHYPGKPLHFTLTADDSPMDLPNLQYTWDFGDGTIAYEQNVTHMFPEAGMFNVTVTVIDNNGASDSAGIHITIFDPEITTTISSTFIFQDKTVFFNASHELDDGSFVYTWYFGDGYTGKGNNVSHIFTRVGKFTPYLIVSTGDENTTVFLPEITVQNVIPVPVIQVDKLQVTEDKSVRFNASGSWDSPSDLPILSYSWDFGDGSKGFGIDVIHEFSDMGNYTVLLTVSDGKSTNSTQVAIEVENLPPTAQAGTPKDREASVGIPVILDASQSLDTDSDLIELNYTWKIGDMRIYGKIVGYTFETAGSFSVILEVRDNNGAVSEDAFTIKVSKSSESDDEEIMSTLSWILIVVMVVLLVVIGFLITSIRDEALCREMKAEEAEEAIVVEGEIDDEMFKPRDDGLEPGVVIAKDQDVEIIKEEMKPTEMDEVKYEEKENVPIEKAVTDYESFKPTPTVPEVELVEDTEVEMPDEEVGVMEEAESVDEKAKMTGGQEDTTK